MICTAATATAYGISHIPTFQRANENFDLAKKFIKAFVRMENNSVSVEQPALKHEYDKKNKHTQKNITENRIEPNRIKKYSNNKQQPQNRQTHSHSCGGTTITTATSTAEQI